MARPLHRCHACGKRRVGVTVVGGRDLCPSCAEAAARASHRLTGPGLAQDRDVWLADCSCGAEFEHPDRVGLDVILAKHLVEAGAAVTVAVTVHRPSGLDDAATAAALRERVENAIGSPSVIDVFVIEGGPS